jgi:putative spermidine/putrescine transport system ATP-binding protein
VKPASGVPAVSLTNLSRHYSDVRAVDDVSLEIRDGEFFSFLGPSGSGKTTTLRLIAGFEFPTAGTVQLHGRDVTRLPPYQRDVHTVFQDYALFPHMSVGENIGYSLMLKKVPLADRRRLVAAMLEVVRLPGMEHRRPSQLSGGQRQRVALARALVDHPRVLLLDEPLGALDLKLREEMQIELKAIQRKVGITFVFVTHDQEEALTMSDRLAVFNDGRIVQVGTPHEVYEHPATRFVAGFVGTSNCIEGDMAERLTGSREPFAIRPEKIRMLGPEQAAPAGYARLPGRITGVVYMGIQTRYLIEVENGLTLTVIEVNQGSSIQEVDAVRGRPVLLTWDPRHAYPLQS